MYVSQDKQTLVGRGCVKTQPKVLSKLFGLVYRAIRACDMLGRGFSTPFFHADALRVVFLHSLGHKQTIEDWE